MSVTNKYGGEMKRKYIIPLFIMSIIFAGCQENGIRRMYHKMVANTIILPDSLARAYDREVEIVDGRFMSDSMLFVVYVDSTKCGTCFLENLRVYEPVYKLSQETSLFKLVILFSPSLRMPPLIEEYASRQGYPFPVYFDRGHTFSERNKLLPEDSRFHSFLLNKERYPVLIGDPTNPNILLLLKDYMLNL